MTREHSRCLRFGYALIMLWSSVALGQITVDATGPIRGRLRPPTTGRFGSIGHKLTLTIGIEVHNGPPLKGSASEVEFTLTNIGNKTLVVPISPHARDMEPDDPKVGYRLSHMRLHLTWGEKTIGSADLYGSQQFPQTLLSLEPGSSVHVIVRADFPENPSTSQNTQPIIVAHASLENQAIRTVNGGTTEDTRELGSATSSDYSLESLAKVH